MTLDGSAHLLELLDIQWPIIQTPMAGAGTPALAAAVSNVGGLDSLGVGATNAEGARKMIAAFRALSARSLNVNVFCRQPAKLDAKPGERMDRATAAGVRAIWRNPADTPDGDLSQLR
jgi:nitronate monooxygenase